MNNMDIATEFSCLHCPDGIAQYTGVAMEACTSVRSTGPLPIYRSDRCSDRFAGRIYPIGCLPDQVAHRRRSRALLADLKLPVDLMDPWGAR